MMPKKVTFSDKLLRKLSCPPHLPRIQVWEANLPGFIVEVSDTGKRFVVRYRGRYQTIGPWPIVSLREARLAALDILQRIEREHLQGAQTEALQPLPPSSADPIQIPPTSSPKSKKIENQVPTLQGVLTEYLGVKRVKDRTAKDYQACLARHWEDYLGKPLDKLTGDAVLERFRGISSPAAGNLSLRIIRALFRFFNAAHDSNLVIPTAKVLALEGAHNLRPRSRIVLDDLQGAWYQAIREKAGPTCKDLFVFLACTGLRLGEALSLTWEDLAKGVSLLTIAETKNGKPHSIPLGTRMGTLLEARKKSHEWTSQEVFPINDRNVRKAYAKVVEASGIEWSPHDLRRGFVSMATRLNVPDRLVKRMVNHAESDVTGKHYVHISPDALKPHMQAVEDAFYRLWEGT